MPDKKYLIEIPDMPDGSGIWDAAKWERNKDKFMAKYPTANVFELGQYDENDTDEHDQFMLTFEDDMESSGVWDAAKWERNKEAFAAKYPNAQVDRVRYIDYWGNKAQSDKARMDELQQPDEARNARLAEMGYYDDITGGQVEFGLDEPGTIGLRPLSSAIEEDIVSGEPSYLDPKVEEFFANDGEYAARQMELNRLREEYERNPRIIEQREYEAQMARYAEDLEKQIISDMESDVDEYHAAQGAVAKHSQDPYGANQVVQAMRMAKGEDVSKDLVENEKLERYQSALKLLQQAKDAREVAGKGLGGGIADTAKDWVRNAATQSDIEMYNEVGNILTSLEQKVGNLNEVSAEDIENNLSNDEKALIRAFFEYNAAMAEAGEDMSAWYKGGKIFAESIPFMMEFLVTGGLANAAGRAATSWMGKGFGRWIAKSAKGTAARAAKKVVAKSVSGVAKTLVAAGARTLVAPTTYKNIAEQSVQYGEDGHLDRDRNMVNAAVDSYIEQLSEMSGAAFGKILGGAGRLALGKTAFDKIGAWFGNNMTMQALSRLGFHGLPEEVGEEIFGNALRTITGVDKEALGRMFEKDEFAAMIIGFAPMTLIGAGVSAAQMGAVSIGAANAGRRMRQDLSRSYTDEQIDQVEMSLDAAKDANEIAEAIRPIIMGMSAAGAPAHEIQSVWDYAIAVAKKKAMISAQSVQEMQLTEAKIREAEEQVGGRFWIENEDGTRDVKQVVLKNGSTVYVVSKPDQDGRVATINTATGQKGTALPDDISEESWNGTLNAFGAGLVMADRTQREQQRMQEDRAAQIAAVRDRLSSDPRINVGTEGSPVYLVAQSFNDAGVRYVAQDGTTGNISWEQAADSIGMPIVVKTDAQIAQEEADALVAAAAERRAKRAKADEVGTIERDNAVEDTENAVADANSTAAHIPMNEDGTVNEAAFWEQNPEEYVKWNDEQNRDGGQDSLQQIAVTRAELMGLLNEANAAQNTSNPGIRKAAKREVERLSDRIARLDAIEQTYMQNLEEEKKAIQQTAATPTSFMSEEELESMDAQYQGILGKTRVQSERVRVMQEYLDKLAEDSVPVVLLTRQNYEEKMKEDRLPDVIINKVKGQVEAGQSVAGFMTKGKIYLMEDGLSSVEEARVTYVHERQHALNRSNPELVQRVAKALGTKENALTILKSFVGERGISAYRSFSLEGLADEVLAYSMEIAYTSAEFSLDLQARGIPSEVISIITDIDNEQRQNRSLSHARRRGGRTLHEDVSGTGSVREDGGNLEQVSGGILEQEATRSAGTGGKGIGDGAEGAEVNPSDNDIRFRTTETNPEDNLSEETIKELADKGLVMDGGVVISDEYAELKQTLGYETPIERGAGIDDLRFAVVTMPGWKKNYLTYEQADKRIVQILEAFAARITANELVNGVIAKGTHKSSKKTKDGKLVEAGPLRSNISYVVTFDLDTTCPRTFQYLNFVRKIERRIGRPLTQVECIQLNEMMRMYGQQIPCVYCYAENKRQAMKQYFNNYITARHAVLSAETDAEALEHMYGREKEGTDPKTVLTEAAYKVFKKWRKNPKGKYNPTMRILWHQYDQARNSVLSLLDMRYAEAVVNTDSANATIAQFVAGELGITNKTAVREIEEIVVEWKWNTIEGRKHDDYTPVDEDDLYANENALEVWRDMVLYAKSASGAKNVNRYVPYTDELKHVDQATRDYINGMGGLRMHSTNDFRIDYVFDYFQFMADMAAARMFGHTYTKSPEFVRIFGNSGYKINMSIAAYQDENGVIRPNVDEGFDWDEVKELRRLFPNAGAMLMATSDEQLQMALDSDWIDMIIPFHHSGLPKAVWYNMRLWTDYTTVQNESFLNTEERTAMLLEAGVEIPRRASTETIEELFNEHFGIEVQYGKSGKRVKPHFLPGPTIVDGVNIPGHNNDHQRYLELCRQWGVKPRFQGIKVKDNTPEGGGREVDITEHPRYMTLVKETARTDSPQVPIQFNFDQPSEALGGRSAMDYAFDELEARAMAESELAGRKVNDIYTSLNNDQFGIVDQFINTIIKHKQETGEDYPMDYLTPESREWFMVQRKALEEAFKDIATIPYHRNEYDEQGNLVSGPGLNLEEKKVVDIVDEAKKAQKKHDAKANKGKKSKKDDVRLRVTARTDEQREQLFDKAKQQYGVTNNFNATGYMLPDGSLLDFSESNDGGDPNRRSLDHRDIEGIIMDEGREYDSRYRYIVDFVNEGAIRMLPESAGFQLSVPPTAEQRSRLMDYIYKHNGEVIMEITDENGSNVAYVEYDRRTSPYRVMSDVDKYFNRGETPAVGFRISNNNQSIFVSNAAKAVEAIKQEKATPEQWLKMIEKAGGLKAGEDKWMGLSDWLKASDKKTLTKAEVLDFINENMIVIEEVKYKDYGYGAEILEALNEKYPGRGHIFDWDEEVGYYIMDNDEAIKLYNTLYEDKIKDEDKDSDETKRKLNKLIEDYTRDERGKIIGEREISDIRLTYTTNGLTNLREIALTVPTIEPWNQNDEIHFGDAGNGRAIAWIRFGETREYLRTEQNDELQSFVNNMLQRYHIDEQVEVDRFGGVNLPDELLNALTDEQFREYQGLKAASMASSDETEQRILVIDEIQSKRHQEGRERGYIPTEAGKKKLEENYKKAQAAFNALDEEMNQKYDDLTKMTREETEVYNATARAYTDAYYEMTNPRYDFVPDAPFDKNWHELAMKRMLRYAAENGYDAIAWTKGEQQAERYGLAKTVKGIEAWDRKPSSKIVQIKPQIGMDILLEVDSEGKIVDAPEYTDYKGKNLSELVGKELAVALMQPGEINIEEDGLKVGGEGMKGFYDKMLPAFMNKYGKKWGVKVEDIDLSNLEKGLTMHSVPVTEEMKASVMDGQVMFKITPHKASLDEIENMFYALNKDKALVPIFRKALDFCNEVHADIEFISDVEMAKKEGIKRPIFAALGWAWGNKIRFNADGFNTSTAQENAATILHEMLHMATAYVLAQKESYLKKVDADLAKAKEDIDAIFEEVKSKYPMRYGTTDQDEMVAEMSNPSFRKAMKEGNLWERFVNSVRDIIGLEKTDNNRLDATMDALNRILDNPDFVLFDDILQDLAQNSKFVAFRITPEVQEEMDAIKASAIVMGNFMKAPNGKQTSLSEEQWLMTRTQNFRKWFGNWENDPENASKVVDENGEPMVVYHGTAGTINKFEDQQRSPGLWFVDREDVAKGYAESASVEFGEEMNVVPVFLNLRNPRIEDAHGEYPAEFALKSYVENDNGVYQEFDTYEEAEAYRKENVPDGWVGASTVGDQHDLVERARELGHDGVIMKDMHDQAAYAQTRVKGTQTNYVVFDASQIKSATTNSGEFSEGEGDIRFSIRTKPAPKNTGIGYKVFYLKDGKLYPPMVANQGGVDTPVGVWLDAEEGTRAGVSKTGRPQVKQGGKGTQGGSGTLAYRPGWHLGEIPYAIQFNRKDENGERTLFPADFVWAEVEYANDVDYQEEAMSYGMNANGKFQHSLAGLPKLPADGSYRYRTNPNPETDPWIITGAMKVNRLLTPTEVDKMVADAGREPQKRQEGAVTDEQIETLNKDLGLTEEPRFRFSAETADDVDIKAMRGISTLRAFNMGFNEMRKIFYDVAEETEKNIMELRAKQNRTAYDEERLARAEKELQAAHRRIGWWESVNSQLVDTTPYEPDLKEDMDLEPRTPAEYIAQFLTMHMTRVNKQSVDKDGRATIKKVNKRAGVMLTQETLRRELGWSEKDWSGFKYIISETEGKSLDEIAEMISEDTEAQSIFVGMDVMEIKDAVIDFLQGIGSYAEIRDYIKNERVREAKDYADYVNRRMAEGIERIESGTGMTIEEYNAHIVAEELKEIESILKDIETSNIYGKFEELTSEENEANQKSLLEGARRGVYESDQIISDYGDGAVDSESSSDEGPREDSGRSDSGDVGDRGGEAGRPGAHHLGHKKKGLVQKPLELSSESAPVDEVVSKGRQKAINENVEANAIFSEKMQRLNDSLAKLRAMLAAQREYDVNTVKIITGLANELMQIGRLTDMSRSEIKRLLSVIKDATGKEDLSIAVERLMDIMIANQLRSGKSKVAELMKIKASKVNASGVEVRGSLDVAGQQMVQTFKEAVARAMTDEALAENIAIEEENLGSDSEVIRKNAENRLAGYYLARQYREDILASEAEEKALRKEISDAKEQYDAGKMDKTAFKEFQKSCYDAIRENRMQRVTSYEKIANQLAAKLAGSILNAKALEDSEKARIERIHRYANSDMQGMPSVQQGEVKKGIWNNTILRFLFKPLATFDQMLRSFAPKSRNGEGYLWRHFMGGWLDASEREFKGIQAAHERLDAKVRSMFAGAKRWSDLFSIEKKMPVMKVKFWDGEKMADFALTQGNLLYIYMVNKMTDGKMKLRKMGITEEDVNNIARELDPRFLELADWIQDTFLPGLREKYNALHEKMFGAPMAAIDNYFPIRVLANARTRDVDISVEESSSKPSTITGSIIKRTKNSLALDILGSDAFDVVLEHIEQMEHWAAFAEFNRDLNTLLSYRKFRNRVQNMRGIYGAGTTVWNNFRATAEIAAGVYKPAVKGDSLDKLITNIAKGVTGAKISFRVYTALKQFLSAPAFVSDASAAELIKSLANPYKAWKWAMDELPLFEKRWKSRQAGDSRLMETESDWKLWKTKIVELAGRYGMTPNAFVDALTVSIGAKSIYETKRKEYIKIGYPVWQAEKKAKRDATVLFNESQQSNESAFLSAAQVDRTVASIIITLFRNSSMGYQRMYVDALRNIKNALRKGYKAESLEYMTKLMVRDGLTQEQAERAANRIYNRSFARNAVRLATFGFLVQFAWNLGPYMAYLLMGDDDDEKKDMIKDAAVRGLVGGPVEGLAAGQSISNVLGDVAMKEAVDDPMLKLPAASDMEAIFNQLDKDPVRAVNDIFNLVIQSGIGVNPQTISDAVVAIIDGCNGDMETSKEAAFALMRILQTPQSQIEKLYMEEIDFTAEEALDMNVREFAERYAKYKIMRTAPLTKWAYSDEKEKELEERYIKTFTKKASEMERTHGTEEAQQFYEYYDTEYKGVSETLRELKQDLKDAVDDTEEIERVNADIDSLLKSEEFKRFEEMLPHIKAYEKLRKVLGETDDPEEREQLARDMIDERNQAVQLLRETEND